MTQISISRRWLLVALLLAAFALLAGSQGVNAQQSQWIAQYYDNPTLSGGNPRVTTTEAAIDHRWGSGSPSSRIPADSFSARWTKTDNFAGGPYRFTATVDDGMRVYLDNQLIIDSWYPSEEHTVTRDVYVSPGAHEIRVEYFENRGLATAVFSYAPAGGGAFYPNWRGEYFNNTSLSGEPVLVRDDRYLNNNWFTNSPAPGIVNADQWSARWTRTLDAPSGTYQISVFSDDGVRIFFDNQLVYNQWGPGTGKTAQFNYAHRGGPLNVRVEYYENRGSAAINFGYDRLGPVGPTPPSVPIGTLPPEQPIAPEVPIGTVPECPAPEGMMAVVNANYLNVRSGPGTQFQVVETLEKCDQVFVTGLVDPTYTWVQLNNPNPASSQQFWVNAAYLDTAVPVSSFTVVR